MRQLNIQLYGRTNQKDFNEELSTRQTVTLSAEQTTVGLDITAPGREKFVELRLDPDDKPTQFVLHDLRVFASDDTEIYCWSGDPDSLTNLIDLRASRAKEQVLLEASSNDPFLLFPLKEPQSGRLRLEMSVSMFLLAPIVDDDNSAIRSLGAHQQELSDAVRSLQMGLRSALDDLAAEQEGLQDALVLQGAQARNEGDALRDELSKITDRANSLEAMLRSVTSDLGELEATLAGQLENTSTEMKSAILGEVREDWRSLNRQIAARTAQASEDARRRDAALAARDEELVRLAETAARFSQSHHYMKQVRSELGVRRDEDAILKLKQLTEEVRDARTQISAFESSLCWRLARAWRR